MENLIISIEMITDLKDNEEIIKLINQLQPEILLNEKNLIDITLINPNTFHELKNLIKKIFKKNKLIYPI